MTREEAIEALEQLKDEIDNWRDSLGEVPNEKEMFQIRGIDMAIEALQQPEILRCVECKWLYICKQRLVYGNFGCNTGDLDFCSRGDAE